MRRRGGACPRPRRAVSLPPKRDGTSPAPTDCPSCGVGAGLVPARAGQCRCHRKRDGTSPSPTDCPSCGVGAGVSKTDGTSPSPTDCPSCGVGAGLVPARAGQCRCHRKRDGTSPSPTDCPSCGVGAGLVPARAGQCRCHRKRDGTSPSPTDCPSCGVGAGLVPARTGQCRRHRSGTGQARPQRAGAFAQSWVERIRRLSPARVVGPAVRAASLPTGAAWPPCHPSRRRRPLSTRRRPSPDRWVGFRLRCCSRA